MSKSTGKTRKPRIVIERTGGTVHPFIFKVKYPGNHWKNSQWLRWDDCLVALGLKPR